MSKFDPADTERGKHELEAEAEDAAAAASDLPDGYRWATAEETEAYGISPLAYPDMIVVVRTADASGVPYTQGEADLALPVTDFSLDVRGQYQGNAYAAWGDYRVTISVDPTDGVQMSVEDSGGVPVGKPLTITDELADGIIAMSSIDHDLSGYTDDWTLPTSMARRLVWMLQTDMDHHIEIGQDEIDEIADWLAARSS